MKNQRKKWRKSEEKKLLKLYLEYKPLAKNNDELWSTLASELNRTPKAVSLRCIKIRPKKNKAATVYNPTIIEQNKNTYPSIAVISIAYIAILAAFYIMGVN